MIYLYCLIPFTPLIFSIITGIFRNILSKKFVQFISISGVFVSFILSAFVFYDVQNGNTFNDNLYSWIVSEDYSFNIGFMIDELSSIMMLVVTFISLIVHIYTVGYMKDDPGVNRFFCYISLFTFAMLFLVMSNNFLQLFFGWEAVGLVSYLLIGFWYTKPSAIHANLKAFLVNRVGDFGFLLGIALIFYYFNTLDYSEFFSQIFENSEVKITLISDVEVSLVTIISILLFIGAMGKSAQFPLHVWLPDSMEGPTPISALIHAATMVTAGIFLVSRMSPLIEFSEIALSFIIIIGSITAIFMGILGIIQTDIKRIIAYSTLSQLGYMTVALGLSAYHIAIFHLFTHAFFKALLFLAAGSVIIGLHHQQDIFKMGGLRKYMPITCYTTIVGSLALIGFPFFSGFFSKESILLIAQDSDIFASNFAYISLLLGVLVTAIYSFRLYFLVFEGEERFKSSDLKSSFLPHESGFEIWLPLIILAIPSILIGAIFFDFIVLDNFFGDSIFVNPLHNSYSVIINSYDGWFDFGIHGFLTIPFLLIAFGFVFTSIFYLNNMSAPLWIQKRFRFIYVLLREKYYFDKFNEKYLAGFVKLIGKFLWKFCDVKIIDGFIVNGVAKFTLWTATKIKIFQTGFIFHYALMMVIGILVFISIIVYFNIFT